MANRNFKIFTAIADIHIGNKNVSAPDLKEQLKKHFFKPLKDFKYLDGIFILGDIMHTIVSLNSDYSELYFWFIDKVYKLAKKKGSTVIIIKGTKSHDNDQLWNIRSYINNEDNVDFRIYETIEETTIWENYKVLVLPDIKIRDKDEVEKYFNSDHKYDIILGHGLIDSMKFFVQESENMPLKTYEYNVGDLCASCKGPIMFGHIHQYQQHSRFYYAGPFTLLERGTSNAGYLVGGIYDNDRSKFKIEHYDNPDSAEYYDLNVSKKIMDSYPIENIISMIDQLLADTKSNDLITLRITRGDERDSADKVLYLEARYKKDRRISIVKKVKSATEEEVENKQKERKEKYAYVMDNNLSLSDIIYKYYLDEVVPTLPAGSNTSKLTPEDFKRILEN